MQARKTLSPSHHAQC